MTRGQIAQAVAASVIVAAVVAGGWSARPLAQDDHSHQSTATSGSDDHPHGALVQAVRQATEPFRDPVFAQAAGYKPHVRLRERTGARRHGAALRQLLPRRRRPARRHASRARDLRAAAERTSETHRRRIPRAQGPVGRRARRRRRS